MKLLLRNILLVAITTPAWLFGACCINDFYTEDNDSQNFATLVIHVGIASPARATGADLEKMYSLRIVLLDGNGIVEYNDRIDNSQNPEIFGTNGLNELDYSQVHLIKTTPGRKKIFLIANEESVSEINGVTGVAPAPGSDKPDLTAVLDSKGPGDAGFEEMINAVYFTPDFDNNLVLSSFYEFTIGGSDIAPDAGHSVKKEFWLVRAASKFEIEFSNYRQAPVLVEELKISSVARDAYLMAHVHDTDKNKSIDGKSYWWVDWLKEVCEQTTANPDNPDNKEINKRFGWIKEYALPFPEPEDHTEKDVLAGLSENPVVGMAETDPSSGSIIPGTAGQTLSFYCPESKYTSPGGAEQEYTLNITLNDNGKQYEFSEVLPEVKALFRNTLVRITIQMSEQPNDLALELKIGICRWDYESIKIPAFD